MNFKYYIGKNAMRKKEDLQTDKFIFRTLEKNPYIGIGGDFEGPYSNLNELIKNSSFYRKLKIANSRTASKLILPKNIKTVETTILTPKGKTFDLDLFNFIQHAIKGEFKNDEISGLHFYNPKNTKITKIYAMNNNGVLDVDILKLNSDSQKWVKKRTTIFPLDWHLGNLFAELELAYLYRFPILSKKSHFGGVTPNGIKVIFIFVNGKPKTAYPII